MKRLECIEHVNKLSNKKMTLELKDEKERVDSAPKVLRMRRKKISSVSNAHNHPQNHPPNPRGDPTDHSEDYRSCKDIELMK